MKSYTYILLSFSNLDQNCLENSPDEQSECFGMLSDEDMAIDSDLIDGKHVDKKDANSRSFPSK